MEKKTYQVISIKEGSFEDSKSIQSILLNEKSKIQKICKNTFLNSTIESLSLSANVSDLEEGWCKGTSKLTKVMILPNNKHFMNIDNKFVIEKSDKSSDEYDTLIFVRRDIKDCTIPSFIKEIAPYAFSESLIESIFIPSQIERI